MSDEIGTFHLGTGKLTATATIAGYLASLLNTPLDHEEISIEDHTSNIAMDSTRALQRLGWKAKILVEEGLTEIVRGEISGSPLPPTVDFA